MALSGSTDFSLNRDELIKAILRLVGAQNFTARSIEYTEASVALNMLARQWAAEGVGVWKLTEVTLTLDTSSESYTLGPNSTDTTSPTPIARPLEIEEIRRVDSDGVEYPVNLIGYDEYMNYPEKDETGSVIQACYRKQRTDGTLYIWPVSDTAEYLKFTAKMPFDDFDASTDDADFPPECYRAVKYNVAADLADEKRYNVSMEDRAWLSRKAEESKYALEGFDTETGSLYHEVS